MRFPKRVVVLLFLFLPILQQLQAQKKITAVPVVGKSCPDYRFKNVVNYKSKTVSISDFKGKFLILDLWHKYCGACISHFPKLGSLQEKYKDKLNILLVGMDEGDREAVDIFKKVASKYQLAIPSAFDSSMFNLIDAFPGTAPDLVWIDQAGIVQAVTGGLSEDDLLSFFESKKFPHVDRSHAAAASIYPYDSHRPFFENNNGAEEGSYLFKSVFGEWDETKHLRNFPKDIETDLRVFKNQLSGCGTLKSMYMFAYRGIANYPATLDFQTTRTDSLAVYGLYYPLPILEMKDSSKFAYDFNKGKGLYMYSLKVPDEKATGKRMLSIFQRDLENYFGYAATVETRRMPCVKLTISDEAKKELLSKGGHEQWKGGDLFTGVHVRNYSWNYFFRTAFPQYLENIALNNEKQLILLDETGLGDTLIDFDMEKSITVRELEEHLISMGFSFVKTIRQMKVLVIRDPNTKSKVSGNGQK
ncbi:MAG: TlpA family protein disulfide reductase [Chitinophagaceae bacterium]|nr:TlpA family protein disulfide reductase [Chitinophagaceae bacterium]